MLNFPPETPQAYLQKSQTLLELGEIDQAILTIEKALAIDVNFVYGLQELASIYQQRDQLDLALEYRQQIVELQPTSHKAYASLSDVLVNQSRFQDAILVYLKALSIPEAPELIYLGLAKALELDGRLKTAISLYEHTIKLFPTQTEAKNRLANCINHQNQIALEQVKPEESVKPYAYFFAQGRDLVAQGLYDEAIAIYTEGNQNYPNHPFSYFMLGHAYSFVDNFTQELAYYYQALDCDVNNVNLEAAQADQDGINYSTLNQNQIDNIFQKIVDATLNTKQTKDLSMLLLRAIGRINDPAFYLRNARKLIKQEELEFAIAFLEQAQIKCHKSNIACQDQDDIQDLLASVKQANLNHE